MNEEHDEPTEDEHPPKVDFSKSLHEAGHETEELGFEGVPDTGPVERNAEAIADEKEAAAAGDVAMDVGQLGLPSRHER